MSEIARLLKRNEQNELLEVLTGVADALSKHTSVMARLGFNDLNGVLEGRRYTLDSTGVLRLSWPSVCGSATVINPSAHALVVVAGDSASTSVPPPGPGQSDVPASSYVNCVIGARSVTIYGTAGDIFTVQAFTGLQAFGVSW